MPAREDRSPARRRCWLVFALSLAALLIAPALASAATPVSYYVSTAGTGTCAAGSPCQLAAAITDASTNDATDAVTINLAAGDYLGPVTIGAGSESSLTLAGAATLTAIDGGGTTQGLLIGGSSTADITIENLTLENGVPASNLGENLEDDGSGTVDAIDDLFRGGSGAAGDASVVVAGGALNISGSTIAGSSGAPAVLSDSSATTTIYGSTIEGNVGGGVEMDAAGTIDLGADVLATNDNSDCDELAGTISDVGYDYVDDTTHGSCGDNQEASTAALDLGALASYGGPTETERITPNSAAYDVVPTTFAPGGTAFCSTTDQRGVPRSEGLATTCDAGAYQYSPPVVTAASPRTALELGLPITLSGYGLGDVTSASFGSTAATITGQSNGSLTLTVPLSLSLGSQPITLTNPDGSVAVQFSAVGPPGFSVTTLAPGQLGVPYSQSLPVAGGAGPYSYALTFGSLPAGLTLSGSGVVSGTPTRAGGSAFDVTLTDANGVNSPTSTAISLVIATPVITLDTKSVKLNAKGRSFTAKVACSSAPCAGSVSLSQSLTVKVDGKNKSESVSLASTRYTLVAGAATTLTLTLTPSAQHALKHVKKHSLVEYLNATVSGGTNDGVFEHVS